MHFQGLFKDMAFFQGSWSVRTMREGGNDSMKGKWQKSRPEKRSPEKSNALKFGGKKRTVLQDLNFLTFL